jgi:hypothetical protein
MMATAHALNREGAPFSAKDTKRGPTRAGWAVSTIHARSESDWIRQERADIGKFREATTPAILVIAGRLKHDALLARGQEGAAFTEVGCGARNYLQANYRSVAFGFEIQA